MDGAGVDEFQYSAHEKGSDEKSNTVTEKTQLLRTLLEHYLPVSPIFAPRIWRSSCCKLLWGRARCVAKNGNVRLPPIEIVFFPAGRALSENPKPSHRRLEAGPSTASCFRRRADLSPRRRQQIPAQILLQHFIHHVKKQFPGQVVAQQAGRHALMGLHGADDG